MCKREDENMDAVVKLPKRQNRHSLSDWLNIHAGCDVDKMVSGDKNEVNKMNRHFEKMTLKVRSELEGKDESER